MRAIGAILTAALVVLVGACKSERAMPRAIFENPPGEPRPPRPLIIDVAAADAPCTFTRGFSASEPWRWSVGPSSRLDFEYRPDRVPYRLEVEARSAPGDKPQVVRVVLNDKEIGKLEPGQQQARSRLPIPDDALRDGHNVLELFYAWTRLASDVDTREIAVAYRSIDIVPVERELTVGISTETAAQTLVSGWSHLERDSVRSFAWSEGKSSSLRFVMAPTTTAYELRLRGLAIAPTVSIAVAINGQPVGRVMPGAGWNEVRLPIERGILRVGANEITLSYSETRKPAAESPGSTDTRELGFALEQFSLSPSPS